MKELKTELIFISVIILFALMGYLLFNSFILLLSLGLFSYLSWHIYQLRRFYTHFISHKKVIGSRPAGLWGMLYETLNDRQNRWLNYRRNKRRIFSRFQQAFKHFPYAVLILDKSWKIRWYNPASKTLFNRDTAIINYDFKRLINHPVMDEYLQVHNFEYPLEIESPIDKVSVLSFQFIPLSDAAETLLIIRNITRTFHLAQARKDFVANVTHELRTPLTVFSGFLEPLCEDIKHLSEQIPQHWPRSIELMRLQSKRMNDIVNELLQLSKLEMSTGTTSEQLIDMPELLQNTLNDIELLTQESGHEISISVQDNLYLKGDIKTIKTIISNLMVNAIKYTPQRSKITLSWYAQSNQAYLIVKDSGEGIAARHLSRLTERFYRVESGRSRDKGGTGLGLSIVHHALLRHQGQLQIASEIGRGSTFTCIFPKERIKLSTKTN